MLPGSHDIDTIPIDSVEAALTVAADLAERYGITTLRPQLAAARDSVRRQDLIVAVLGRFKAGKSTFLNQLAGGDVLPTGVVPVTAVITELGYGPRPMARVHHLDGRTIEIPSSAISGYASEKENPRNRKDAGWISVELPELLLFRGLRFVDTPGLDSAFAHNTETSLQWLPNTGLALVAISVDPPLSAQDIELLRTLGRYTPEIWVLLTKADLLCPSELDEVSAFVRSQLAAHLATSVKIFPYSIKPGFEHFRGVLECELRATCERLPQARRAIAARKLDSVLAECSDFLMLSLQAADAAESERRELERHIAADDQTLSSIQLAVARAAAQARAAVDSRLEEHRSQIERSLLRSFEGEFPHWSHSLAAMLSGFERWLTAELRMSLAGLSRGERNSLRAPLDRVRAQATAILQQFRDRLSDRTLRAFGVPLRTSETEVAVTEPGTPDIRIGRIFDRNWEVLSPILPVWAIRGLVRRHFSRTIPYAVYQNLSRLGAQWEQTTRDALHAIEGEAGRRHADFTATVRHLIATGGHCADQIRSDLDHIQKLREAIGGLT